MALLLPIEFFDYTFIKSRVWLLFAVLYGAWLVGMAGAVWVLGVQQQRDCDSFIISNHIMDPGLNRYGRTNFDATDPLLAAASEAGCRIIYRGAQGGSEHYDINQISKKQILYARWTLSWTFGGI